MRVNAKALMRVAEIRCVYHDASGASLPARVSIVTEGNVRAAREMGERDISLRATETSPEVRYGGVLAYMAQADGSVLSRALLPGEDGGLRLRDGTAFLGQDMFEAEEKLSGRAPADLDAQLALSGIRSVFQLIVSAPDEGRFPISLIAQAYRSALRTTFGPAMLPVPDDGFVRKAQADLMRARIGQIEASHPDAIGYHDPFARVLDRAGADARADGVSIQGTGRIAKREARLILEDERFRKELFGAMTVTHPNRIDAAVLPLQEVEDLDRALCDSKLGGAWVEGVNRLVADLTGAHSGTGWYRIDLTLYVSGGRDLMILNDSVGREHGIALVYSWPTVDRKPVFFASGGPVYAICSEEVPEDGELIRLRQALDELEASRTDQVFQREILDA